MEPNMFTRIGVALHKLLAATHVDQDDRAEIHRLATELQTVESDLAGIAAVVDQRVAAAVAPLESRIAALEGREDAVEAGLSTIDSLLGSETETAPAATPVIEPAPAKDETAAALGDAPVTDETTGVTTAPEPAPAAGETPASDTLPAGTGEDTVTAPAGDDASV